MVHLILRLSYHDVRMFSQMLESLPKQTRWARSHSIESTEKTRPANFRSKYFFHNSLVSFQCCLLFKIKGVLKFFEKRKDQQNLDQANQENLLLIFYGANLMEMYLCLQISTIILPRQKTCS